MISISVMMRDLSSISKFDYALHCVYLFLFILPNVNEISKPSFLPLLLLFSPLTVELVSSFFYCLFFVFLYEPILIVAFFRILFMMYSSIFLNVSFILPVIKGSGLIESILFLILFSKQKEFKHVVVLVDPIQQMNLTLFLGLRLVLVHHTLVLFDDLHHL